MLNGSVFVTAITNHLTTATATTATTATATMATTTDNYSPMVKPTTMTQDLRIKADRPNMTTNYLPTVTLSATIATTLAICKSNVANEFVKTNHVSNLMVLLTFLLKLETIQCLPFFSTRLGDSSHQCLSYHVSTNSIIVQCFNRNNKQFLEHNGLL